MTGRNSFKRLADAMSEPQKANVAAKKDTLRAEMSLAELRSARNLTQETIGSILEVGQPSVAKLERRTDMYLGTLRRYIQATGGELEIVAHYPDGDVKITTFSSLAYEGPANGREAEELDERLKA